MAAGLGFAGFSVKAQQWQSSSSTFPSVSDQLCLICCALRGQSNAEPSLSHTEDLLFCGTWSKQHLLMGETSWMLFSCEVPLPPALKIKYLLTPEQHSCQEDVVPYSRTQTLIHALECKLQRDQLLLQVWSFLFIFLQ